MSSETRLLKNLFLDKDRLYYHGKSVHLDGQQRILMRAFLNKPGQLISLEKLRYEFYSGVHDTDLPERPDLVINVRMHTLRKKLTTLGIAHNAIVMIRGEGYWFDCKWVKEELMADHEETVVRAAMEVVEWRRALRCGMPAHNALKQALLGYPSEMLADLNKISGTYIAYRAKH